MNDASNSSVVNEERGSPERRFLPFVRESFNGWSRDDNRGAGAYFTQIYLLIPVRSHCITTVNCPKKSSEGLPRDRFYLMCAISTRGWPDCGTRWRASNTASPRSAWLDHLTTTFATSDIKIARNGFSEKLFVQAAGTV